MSNYNAQKRENFPKGNNAGKSRHDSSKVDFKETYFKTTYQYLNNINEENIELDMVFNAISLNQLIAQIHRIINKELDCVIIYSSRHSSWAERKVLGIEQNPIKNIL